MSSTVSTHINDYVSKRDRSMHSYTNDKSDSSRINDGDVSSHHHNYNDNDSDNDNDNDDNSLLQSFNLSAPTAAVIGAGMAGVHVAYELA